MGKRRCLQRNKNGVSSVIETIIATAIIFTILALFYGSLNSLYNVHIRADIDLQVKCNDVCEMFISSPGKSITYNINWEDAVTSADVNAIGLATTPTIAYGTFITNSDGQVSEVHKPIYDSFQHSIIGKTVPSCFIAGTKIIKADGAYVNIEDVKIGDMVKSFNLEKGSIVDRKVTNIFHHPPEEMTDYYLVINDFLKVTPNHRLYNDGQWVYFDQISVGDIINNVVIYSVEKVFEQVPTFNLEIEEDHNYFVCFSDNPLLVHNDPVIDPNPWVATSKDDYVQLDFKTDFTTFGDGYYVEHTPLSPSITGIYEIKDETNYVCPILDSDKIDSFLDVSYADLKTILGFEEEYQAYDFSVNISSVTYNNQNGVEFDFADIVVSTVRNVLIYHPPKIGSTGLVGHLYENGQITVRMYMGGIIRD